MSGQPGLLKQREHPLAPCVRNAVYGMNTMDLLAENALIYAQVLHRHI